MRNEQLLWSLREALQTAALEPWILEFELTEHAHVAENPQCLATLRRLRELGCKIALDDFGSGHSSLQLLQQFRFDSIKLAPWFIANLPVAAGSAASAGATGSEYQAAVAQAVIDMARRLGLRTLALGVTSAEQLSFLQAMGCEEIQGDWLSASLPAEQCEAFIRNWPAGQINSHSNSVEK